MNDDARIDAINTKLDELLARAATGPARFLTVEGAAAYSGLSTKSIRRLIARGELEAMRPVKGRVLVDRQAIDSLILGSTARVRCGRGIR